LRKLPAEFWVQLSFTLLLS